MTYEFLSKSSNGDYLVTIAIGDAYFEKWREFILPSWKIYADVHGLGIAVARTDLIDRSNPLWKKPTWQKMLIPSSLSETEVIRVCYLDTDILINPFAPNIFEYFEQNKIGVTSIRSEMPYEPYEVQKKLAFFRNKYIDPTYPLDSSLFFTTKQLYEYHKFVDQGEEFCAGLLLFSNKEQELRMRNWFNLYDSKVESITNGGDQTHLNYHIISEGIQHFIPYKFQAIWAYEAAWNHPDLFMENFESSNRIKNAISSVLLNNHFLHFAGGSKESKVIWDKKNFDIEEFVETFKGLILYSKEKAKTPVLGTTFAN
jgi:hypothetical protein